MKIKINPPILLKINNLDSKTVKIAAVTLLVVLGIVTRFFFIWQPAEVVFDEVHYGKSANGYLRGENFFSGHPPLGLQLIALAGWLGGYRPLFSFANINEKFTDKSYIALRFMPNLAGSLIPAVVTVFLLILGASIFSAFTAGTLLVLENALLVQSHFILIDAFVILFGFIGLCFFFISRQRNYNIAFLLPAGLFFALSFSVKWAGLSFLFLALLSGTIDFFKKFPKVSLKESGKDILKFAFCLVVLPSLVYFADIVLHFKLLPNKGPGDAYFSKEFLEGQKNIFAKFKEFNKVSYVSNIRDLIVTHPYSSKWFAWPFGLRPIYYWAGEKAQIHLAGNPVIWWFSTAAVIVLLLYVGLRQALKNEVFTFLLAGYFINLLLFITVKRTTFLYHYLAALIFAILILVCLLDTQKNAKAAFTVLLLLALAGFIYFAPVTYGLPRYF